MPVGEHPARVLSFAAGVFVAGVDGAWGGGAASFDGVAEAALDAGDAVWVIAMPSSVSFDGAATDAASAVTGVQT